MNFYDELKEKVFKIISKEIENDGRVLDTGCGSCDLIIYLAKQKGVNAVGVDMNNTAFKEALEKVDKKAKRRIKCIKGDAGNLKGFEKESFSSIISLYSLHEFSSPSRVLKECMRVLKKQGKLIVVDFLLGTLAEELWGEKYFTTEKIKEMMDKAGFRILKQRKISKEGPLLTLGMKELKYNYGVRS